MLRIPTTVTSELTIVYWFESKTNTNNITTKHNIKAQFYEKNEEGVDFALLFLIWTYIYIYIDPAPGAYLWTFN